MPLKPGTYSRPTDLTPEEQQAQQQKLDQVIAAMRAGVGRDLEVWKEQRRVMRLAILELRGVNLSLPKY